MQMYFMYLRILRMCNGRYSSVIRSCFRKHLICIIWFALGFFSNHHHLLLSSYSK